MDLQRRLLGEAYDEYNRLTGCQSDLYTQLEQVESDIAEAKRVIVALGGGPGPATGPQDEPPDEPQSAVSGDAPPEPIETASRRTAASNAEARDWIVDTGGEWFSLTRLCADGYGVKMQSRDVGVGRRASDLLEHLIKNGGVESGNPDPRGRERYRYVPREEAEARGLIPERRNPPQPTVSLVGLPGGRGSEPVAGTGGGRLPKHVRELLPKCRPGTQVIAQVGYYAFVADVNGQTRRVVASRTPRDPDTAKRRIERELRDRQIIGRAS